MSVSYFSPLRMFGALLFAICVSGAAYGKDDGNDHSVTIEKSVQSYVINSDGSFVLDVELVSRINEERAIKARAQHPLSYNRALETLEVVEAFTQKPDGRKVLVGTEQIKEQQEQVSSQAPMFQDSRVKVVIFPEVAVGDRLVLRYQRHRTTALFPQQFEDISIPEFNPMNLFSLTYDLPADMPLYSDTKGFKPSMPKAAPGRKVYRWDYVPAEKARIEQGAVSYVDYGQYLAVSTFANFKDFARAYQERAGVEVTPAITELAEKLTANLRTPRAKALALSDWVRENIRYVAVYVGAGAVVPHSAQAVLDNRYGDCKDHVALLEALLKAVAIESSPALINLGNAYTLPTVPTLGLLNHVITYVPSLDLYMDSTDSSIAAGYLPILILNKPVLLTASGERRQTPANQFSKVVNDMTFKVAGSGAADFTSVATIEGWAAESNRYVYKSMKPTDRDLLIQQILTAYGQTGSGKFKTSSLVGNAEKFKSTMTGRTDNLVNLPGPIGVPTLSSLAGGILQNVFAFASEKERTQGFVCISSETEETSRFEFPKEVSILAVPKAVTLQKSDFDYSATYTKDGDAVVIKRRLKFTHPDAVCSPEEFAGMKPVIEGMVNDLKSQIIVQTL
ncbi:Transglutaminase-like superfamily protein [Pseudomonas chlororaphis]|uniref:DUF3857 domain-containing transglutaminase family protein n=1 Tax=Pseudomonas chlororaphis TaxID=587753 RepID=UPI00087C1CAC|nr:Transglutaminase-like enzyme, putative cysteine protease [Pseudomonas chlororaphis subsp. aurantiaca]AZD73837.1 Transglutaminase-like enzyme, putative cysteine protease [Pseudomonas chlororaphis subsp. aurantiaca]SDT05725.1 Transglutaminase-like superfamily protein [Pseudomonas chlororaphis]